MKNFKIGSSLIVATALILGGCGDDSPNGNHGELSFPANSTKAQPTISNGQKVEAVVTAKDIQNLSDISGISKTSAESAINTTQLALKSAEIIQESMTQEVSTHNCDNGGTIKTSVSASLTSTNGAYTTIYDQCNEDGMLIDGTIEYTASITDYASDSLDSLHIYFTTDFSIKDLSTNKVANIKQNSNFTISEAGSNKVKLELSIQATSGANYYGQDNSVYYIYDNNNNTYIYQTEGRIYINSLNNYVDYDRTYNMSQTPFEYNSQGTLTSGEAHYLMADNGKLKIKVESPNNPVTYIDADGDGAFEQHE